MENLLFVTGMMVFVSLIVRGFYRRSKAYRRNQFRKAFNFFPPEPGEENYIYDTVVEACQILVNFAKEMEEAFNWQVSVRKRASNTRQLRKANKQVDRAKKDFWLRHGLAKEFGYPVEESYKIYLTDEKYETLR